jgi:hypothetical protein
MTRLLTLVALILICHGTKATDLAYPYEWEKNRSRYTLSAEDEKLPEIILKDHLEYAYTFENDQFIMYTVVHRIVRVNNSEAIQRHNRIKISMARTIDLVEVRARAINTQSKVVTFDKSNLKQLKEEGKESGEQIFAVEGVEVGSEVEYYFVRKMMPSMYLSLYFQMDVPVRQASFILKCPKHLEYDFKVYNSKAVVNKGTLEKENVYEIKFENLPAIREEAFAHFQNAKARLEFKLAYNNAKSKARLYTWEEAAKDFYSTLYKLDKDDSKSLEKFVKSLKDNQADPLSYRIRSLERQIKGSIQLDENASGDALDDIGAISTNRVASKFGLAKLFALTFQSLNIDCQVVLVCSREYANFDESFDTWSYLDDYIFYFPETKHFLSPYNQSLSYPIIDPEFTSQKALFIEAIQLGALKSGLAAINEVPAAPYHWNEDNLDITVKFNPDMLSNEVNLKRKFKGYNASFIAPYYHLMNEQEKLTMIENLLKETAPGLVVKKWTANPDFTKEVDEFNMDVDFTSAHFVERAGPRLLFKAGLLIGPQSELYSESKRVLNVENSYNRGYDRVIKISIPGGYVIRNPDDLNFNVQYKEGDLIPFLFESSYKLQDNTLIITLKEHYTAIYAPLHRYEDFRKVINAAADFNKVTLVLEKLK